MTVKLLSGRVCNQESEQCFKLIYLYPGSAGPPLDRSEHKIDYEPWGLLSKFMLIDDEMGCNNAGPAT